MISAAFVDKWLTRPTREPDWGWTHRSSKMMSERISALAAPYPQRFARRAGDPFHALFLQVVSEQQARRIRGESPLTWKKALAREGICTREDVRRFFAERGLKHED